MMVCKEGPLSRKENFKNVFLFRKVGSLKDESKSGMMISNRCTFYMDQEKEENRKKRVSSFLSLSSISFFTFILLSLTTFFFHSRF